MRIREFEGSPGPFVDQTAGGPSTVGPRDQKSAIGRQPRDPFFNSRTTFFYFDRFVAGAGAGPAARGIRSVAETDQFQFGQFKASAVEVIAEFEVQVEVQVRNSIKK